MQFKNICANSVPRQIAGHYTADQLEGVQEVTTSNDPNPLGTVVPTVTIVAADGLVDVWQWDENPDKTSRWHNTWVKVNSYKEAEAA